MKRGIKIAISGKSGCGNSTVSKLVAEKLNLKWINYTFRSLAKELNITFEEVRSRAEEDPYYDRYVDRKQVELAQGGDCVLGSRLAIWMLTDADLKVFLNAPLEVRASRISLREGKDPDRVLTETQNRDEKDTKRYRQLYGIDNNDYTFADLVLDVSTMDQYEAAEAIIGIAEKIN
jgi:cytidylate kinase